MISFTRHYIDRSNNNGFRFQFYCDRHMRDGLFGPTHSCSTIYTTDFKHNPLGVVSTLAQAAGLVINHAAWRIGHAGQLVNEVYKNSAWEQAYAEAVEEAKKCFKQCPRCSGWVCKQNCWNLEATMCLSCAPHLGTEAAAMKAQAAKIQVAFKAAETDHTKDIDMEQVQHALCPHCGERSSGGKFCGCCGKQMAKKCFCPGCGSKLTGMQELKFCPSCGDKL